MPKDPRPQFPLVFIFSLILSSVMAKLVVLLQSTFLQLVGLVFLGLQEVRLLNIINKFT